MAQDKIKALYDTFVKEGYDMESEAQFRKNLADPAKRKAAYNALVKDGYNMEAYDAFETNIGFGKQAQPTPAQPKAEAPAQQPAPVEQAPEQPRWQPTEQEKIRMAYNLNSMMSDFNKRSRARVERSKRMAERFTPEGRKKQKAAKFQAQLAGTPTQLMGLTPNAGTAPADGQGNQGEGGDAPKPLLSGQGPVPYGVVIENGERKTQWLLPDGSLTTDLIEADKAEYGARRVRLMNQFVGRMKKNGLDPSKQEDVERQAQLDYEAPMRKVLDQVWAQAEQEDREADEEYARQMQEYNSTARSNLHAVGPDGMPLPTAEENLRDYNRAVKRKETFNLERMAENIYSNLPDSYRREQLSSYTRYFNEHPEEAKGKDVSKAAEDALRGEVYNAVYERAVAAQLPQGKMDFLMRKLADQPLLSPYMAMDMAASSMSGSWGMNAAAQDAMARYGQEHRALDIIGSIGNMAIDPTTYFAGGIGSIAGKKGIQMAGQRMLKGATKEMAERYAANRLAGRIAGGVAGGAANFATFEAMKDIQGQMQTGGVVNPETGEREFSLGSVLNSGVHGALIGGATGTLSPLIGNVADKAVKATSSTAGKMGVSGAELLTSTVAEGTIFSIPDWISGEQDAFDVWTDNMAMMAGFKLSHGIKSAPKVIASLRPVKPTAGRPLTREERIHNRKSFGERLREGLDRGQGITAEEREELRANGYGELSDLFAYDPEYKSRKVDAVAQTAEGDVKGVRGLSTAVDYNPRNEETAHPEFDGYEAMERLMEDGRVSEATRAKAYYILTGRMLPMSTVTGWNQERAEDGSIIVQSLSNQGGVVTSRRFSNEESAQREIDNIKRQAELNTIDIGEQFREAVADEEVMQAAINSVARGADPQTIYRIYESVKRGDKDVTEDQRALAGLIDEALESNASAGDGNRPAKMRERISAEIGVDVDKALRTEPGKRTELEQEAVERYARELFPEQEQYVPDAEETEADRIYDESRRLYGRYEQGEPEAQGEIDAIALRMNEAYQLAEDAFGAESEYYMARMSEDPWGLLNDPDLTPEQRDAVLYCINAKAALDGVLDASNEASQDKRDKVSREVQHRTHMERGVIVPAVMKVDDRPTYIVKGDVAMYPDGSGVDVRNSSESIIILDENGDYKFSSPDQVLRVGDSIDPSVEVQSAFDTIDQEQEEIFSVDLPFEPTSGHEGEAPADGNISEENIPAVNVEEYDRGYSDAIEEAQSLTDERLDHYVESLREGAQKQLEEQGRVDDYIRGRLEALEYAQQDRAANGVPKTDEIVPNPTENVVSDVENVSETDASVENGQETALSRIPVGDDGEPVFESAPDPATAWDGLVEVVGDDAGASEIAQAQIAQATADLEKLKKKPPTLQAPKLKGSPMAMAKQRREAKEAYDKAMEGYNQQIADTQGRLDAWHRILAVQTSRNAELRREQEEARRQRDAELHDAAVAEFEEQQRIKAEKQAEQDAIGTHAVNPKIREKWEASPKQEGNEDSLTLPDGSSLSGRYMLTEAGAASASHDINNAFAPTDGFPIDKNGQSVNDRDYARDKDAQRIVEQMADQYDNRSLQDPVIVSRDGIVLSGNNRTMSGDLAARQGTDTAYIEYLRKFGKKYGFTPEQVAGMKNPRVVFVPDEALPYDATTFARFNAQEKKSQSKPEAAVKLGKVVADNVFANIVSDISRYDRLSGFYADEQAVAQTLGALQSAGVINDKQMPELRTGTTLSAAGKELIENTLIGKVFQSNPEAVRQIIAIPTLRESVVMGLSEIASNRTLSKQGFDLSDELGKAIDLVQRAKATQPDVFTEGVPVSPFGRMQGLFDDEYGDSSVTDATTLLLADILNSGKPSELRKVLAAYNQKAGNSAAGQMDLFTGEIPTKEEILRNVNEHFRQSTPKEQQALVEAAIAERKQRAEAEAGQRGGSATSEQTEDALQRDAEHSEPTAGAVATEDKSDLTPEEEALQARVEVTDNDWEEESDQPGRPIYKREIVIDGKHKATQVDAPDDKGSYTGSYFEYDGKRFGYIGDVADYIDGKSAEPTTGERIATAESDVNLNPTDAQKEAGNYKKGHVQVGSFDVTIENPKGSTRKGTDRDGKKWETTMTHTYGYIRGTKGVDGDHIDVYLSSEIDGWNGRKAYVVDQYNPDGTFDEHKVMLGFNDKDEAFSAYLSNYENGWEKGRRLDITEVNTEDFEKWIESSKRKAKPFAEYKSISETRYDNMGNPIDSNGNLIVEDLKSVNDISDSDFLSPTRSVGMPTLPPNVNDAIGANGRRVIIKKDIFVKNRDTHSELTPADSRDILQRALYNPNLVGTTQPIRRPDYRVAIQTGDKNSVVVLDVYAGKEYVEIVGWRKVDSKGLEKMKRQSEREGGQFLILSPGEGSAAALSALPSEVSSVGKDNALLSEKQISGGESSEGYKIGPATYKNKKGKETPMHRLTFGRDLTKEEESAIGTFAREKLGEGKFAPARGWKDRENGGWLFRNEEDARKAAEMVDNPEAVADAQPLSKEDIKEGARKKKAAPKPKNEATLQDIAEDPAPEEKPAPADKPADAPKGQFKVTDEMREIEDELRSLLGIEDDEGDRGIYFRDDELTPEERRKRDRRIFALGVDYACYFIDKGISAFPDFAKAIVGRLGNKARPFIKAWYDGLRRMPDYTDKEFTPFEDVSRFDIENFDKPDYDALRDAEMRLAERKAQEASKEAEKELIEQRNQQRKEDEKQRETDTTAIADKGEAVASEAESVAETSEDAGELAGVSEKIDDALAEVNEQLALLGYYEAEEVDKDFNEAYGYMRNAEKKALKDAVELAKQLVNDLGIEIDKVAGSTTAKKSKTPTAVRANIAPAGGDITIALPLNEGRELAIYIGLDPAYKEDGEAHNRPYYRDDLAVRSIMYRVENPNASGYDRYGRNCWANADVTYKELLSAVERETYKYLPERTSTEGEYKSGDSVEYSSNGGREWTASKVVEVNADGTLKLDTGMAPVIYVNATLDQVRRKGAAPAEKLADAPKETPKAEPKKPAMREVDVEGLMGAVSDATRKTQQDGQEREVKLSDHYKPTGEETPGDKPAESPADATAAVLDLLKGGKPKKEKKSVTSRKKPAVKPEQTVGDLFSGLFDEPETPTKNEKGTASAGSRELAEAERPDTLGNDETGTDGGKQASETGNDDRVGESPATSENMGGGTDGTAHGTDEERGLQQPSGNRGRDERGTDSGVGSAGVERGGTAGEGPISERSTDGGAEGLSEGEPAAVTGEGGGTSAVSNKPKNPSKRYTNNFRYDEDGNAADTYTPAQRLEGNVAAVETLADVLFGDGKPTEEQKLIMSRFRGWGQVDLGKFYSLDQMANPNYNPSRPLRRLAEAIKRLDPKDEKKLFDAIKRASLSAYYTPTLIARAMNRFLGLAGFRGGQFLDPSMGNGIFEGTLHQKIQERTAITGVELDWLSGQLSRLLYPDANIIVGGFEKSGLTPGSFDVVTSNVPFGQFGVNDPSWKSDSSPIKRSAQNRIHNYYAVKMLELTRPGGLVSMMTSTAVMDTPSNQNIRAHIAEQGEIIGAIRLPDNTFQGTGATADIIFIRKWRDAEDRKKTREEGDYVERVEKPFLSLHETTAPNKVTGKPSKVRYNGYYAKHPKLMIGEVRAGNQYSQEGFGLTSDLDTYAIATEVELRIGGIVGKRKGTLYNPTRTTRKVQQAVREAYKGDGNWESNGNLVVQDGKVGILNAKSNEYGEVTRVFEGTGKHDKMLPRIESMIEVRTAMKKLIAAQIEGERESALKKLRDELQTAYNNFVKKYGKLQDPKNDFILDDIDGYTIQALEKWKSGKFVGLSDIFTKNTIKPALRIDGVKTPQEAITTSLAEYGYIRPDYITKILGEDWASKCGDFIFKLPNAEEEYVTKDEYLSGDVVTKLAEAREAAKRDQSFEHNVKALESVQPERIPFDDIAIHLGARWISDDILNDFMKEIFGLHATARGRHYDPELGRMVEDFKSGVRYLPDVDSFEINVEKKELGGQAQDWETPKKSAKEIFQAALEDKTIVIKWKDEDGVEHPDEEQTELANQKVADLRERFEQWLPSDPARVERLEQDYNDRFNRIVIRKFDGSHLVVPGLMGKELRPHQKDAVWMLINNRGGIVDHIVGAGKTLVMQSAIMEMRRMGIAKKPMIVALKSTVSQIAKEFKEAFPSARVLAPNDKDFQKENRKKFIANISLNDYDCVILSHEQYCMLPHTEEAERAVIDEQLWQLDNMIEYLYGQTQDQLTKRQVKALEKRRENLIARLEKRLDRSVDREFCFENLGVDYMFVDECHQFKSLPYVTSYDKIAGLGDASGSNKAIALLTGIRHLQKMHQGDKGTIFLSGTTITNSLVEIYNLLNYLRPRELERLGMPTFDAWASTFAVHTSELEAGTTGDFKMKDRFRSFDNVPELSQLYAEIADVRNDTNLKLPKPSIDGHTVIVPQSEAMAEINREIIEMLNNKDGSYFGIFPKNPNRAPWGLHASTLSAKAAVSPRLIFPDMDDDGGKVAAVCENVKKCYDEMSEQKGVQLIFCEIGVPEKGKKYDAYTDMINRLTQNYGIPRKEIAYIQEAPTEEKRKALFQKVRDGEVRILIGGTKNMGTGVNVQDRITDMHMLTVPWTPSALEQCIGRGARQGNLVARDFMNDKVRVHYYATEGSLDLYKYQLLDAKGKMFTQFKMGTVNGGRSFDEGSADEDGNIDPAEMVAILSGNPVIFEKAKQEKAVKKLRALRNGFERDYQRKRAKFNELSARKQNLERFIRLNSADRTAIEREGFVPDEKGTYPSTVTVRTGSAYYGEQKTFDKPKEAGEYIHKLLKGNKTIFLTGFGKTARIEHVSEDQGGLFSAFNEVVIGEGIHDIVYRVRLSDDAVNAGLAFRSVMKKIVDNGGVYSRELDDVNRQLDGLNLGDGIFPKQKELDEAVAKLKELTTEYNKLGKPKDTNDQSDKTKFRLVEDKETLDFLENQLQKKGYRYAQWANHSVLPPMTAKVNGEWRPPMLFGRYEQSEEGMRKANGKADLVQGNGRTTGDVAYNPYFHIRTNPLNDQFSAAYDRPELIVVEGYYPESEETSGYKADGAKNSVGLMAWHSGSVNGQLSQDTKVNTMLSRYFKPSRIVPWSEVADLIMENIGEQNITFPLNVVPPMLRAELAKRGARFEGISGNVTESDIPKLKEIEEQIKNGNYEAGLERAKEYEDAYQSSPDAMSARVSEIAEKLHTPVRIVSTSEEASKLPTPRKQRAKGFYDPDTNEIVVVLPNNVNVADIENTVVHEVVGHKGLRALIGEEQFDRFLDEVYDHLSAPLRKVVEAMERKLYDKEVDRLLREKQAGHANIAEANENYYNDMAEAHIEAGRKRKDFKREATEEYMADLGGRIGDKGFEKMSQDELTLWGKIKAKVQQFLDKFLRGLKIAKSIRLNDKDLSYILFKSWKNMRENNIFAKAEDAAKRHKSGYDADERARYRDPGMGLEETITKMKAEAMQANADNLQAKRDAMRAIGGNLNHLRSAMARQREYDITTVKSVTDLAKTLMETGLLDTPSNGEVKRLLGAVNAVVGRQDTSAMVRRVFDIMLHNYLGRERKTFDTLLTIKGSKVDARGVEVQGMLDPKGQMLGKAVRRLINMKLRVDNQRDDFDELIARAEGDLGDESAIKRENAEIELEALYIARQYATDIAASKDEEAELRQCMKDAETDHKEGRMSDDAYRQYMATANEDIRANLIARAEAYESLIERLGERLNESIEEAKAWREEAKERVNQIHHYANSDLKDIPYRTEDMKHTFGSKLSNFPLVRLFMAPTATMEQVCRLIGSKSVDGNGYIKKMVVDRWQECRDKEWIGTQKAEAKMDAKANEIAGAKHWSDLYSISRKKAGTLSWRDGNEQVEHDVTQGNLMYVYMADKMSDGRRLLRHMGITDDDVENATTTLDPRLREIADWVQDDFLPELRERYNETHKRMYGAPMAKIDNYVPLQVNKSTIDDKTDIAENTTYDGNMLPKTITGSIIKRTRHNHPIDIIGTDGVSLILDHVRENETWNAMSEYRRDLTTLLRYNRFRNRLRHMKTIYGSGEKFDKLFFDLAMLVGGAYRPRVSNFDKIAVNITKLATWACIALRINTALKQFLSYPAFGGEAASTRLLSNIARPRHCLNFCLDNLPAMQRRWRERLAGNEVLRDWNGDWDWTRAEWVKKMQRIGITPNSFVDLLTCCMGAEAAYQSKLKELKDAGFDKDAAHRKAVIHAEQVFNLSQQSSELPYLSLLQNDRSYITTSIGNFRSSPFSYLRQSIQSKRELMNMTKNKTAMIEFETKKGVRDGLTPDQAEAYANKKYNRNWARNIIKSLDFDFILPALWYLGITGMWYLVFGKDNDKKKELLVESAKRGTLGPLEGLTFGGTIPDAVYSLLSGDKYKLEEETSPAMGHIKDLWNSAVNGDNIGATNHFANFAMSAGVGINPQTLEDVIAAGMDYFGNDKKTLRDFEMFAMRVISVPQSQVDMVYFDEVALTARQAANMNAYDLAERYASYKLLHNEFATVWFYNDEQRKEREARHRKKAEKIIKEELDKHVSTDSVRSLIAESDEITKTEGELAKLKKARKYSEYREGMSRLRHEHDMQAHARVKRYKHDIDLLTKQFLAPGISREESDSIVGKMIQKRENLMNYINNRKK